MTSTSQHTMNAAHRQSYFDQLEDTTYDLVIIGGGITGAGIALDAALRGLKTVLVERRDFASGTSSKSTKLIHGGLRYLKQLAFGLVKEVGSERAIVHHMAPHLVHPEKMLLPIYKGGSMTKLMASAAISVYDWLADVSGDDRKKMLNTSQAKQREPLLSENGLRGAALYAEYRTDDARLTIELLKTAAHRGDITLLNYTTCKGFEYGNNGQIEAVVVEDVLSGISNSIRTTACISAAGPWVDEVRKRDNKNAVDKLILAKGVHIVLRHEDLPVQQSIYFDVPGDSRMIFAIPRADKTYVGTTDTFYKDDKDLFKIYKSEVAYLLNAVNETFPQVNIGENDIVSSWAGVRPLIGKSNGGSASEISRKDEIFVSDSGLITIAGGKLTGFRKMAERALDKAMEMINKKAVATTHKVKLIGARYEQQEIKDVSDLIQEIDGQINHPKWADYLVKNYGLWAKKIVANASSKDLKDIWRAEVQYLIDHELALSTSDILNRRTGRLYFYPETISDMEPIVQEELTTRGLWNEKLESLWADEKKYSFEFFES